MEYKSNITIKERHVDVGTGRNFTNGNTNNIIAWPKYKHLGN